MSGSEHSIEELAAIVEHAPLMIWRSDSTGSCDYFNSRWLSFRGRTMEEETGDRWTEGVHRADVERCLGRYRSALAARRTFEMEYRLLRYDGAYRWIWDRGAPFFHDEGGFLGYIGSCIDVHELRLAQVARDREALNLGARDPGRGIVSGEERRVLLSRPGSLRLQDVERAHIIRVLEQCDWKVAGKGNAAERLDMKRGTLRSRMLRLGIVRPT